MEDIKCKIEELTITHYKCLMKKKPHHEARKRTPLPTWPINAFYSGTHKGKVWVLFFFCYMIIWIDCTLILYHAINSNDFHDILIICVAANSLSNQTTFKGIALILEIPVHNLSEIFTARAHQNNLTDNRSNFLYMDGREHSKNSKSTCANFYDITVGLLNIMYTYNWTSS